MTDYVMCGRRDRASDKTVNMLISLILVVRPTFALAVAPAPRRSWPASSVVSSSISPPLGSVSATGAAGKALVLGMLVPAPKFLLIGCVPAMPFVMHVPDLALFLPWVLLGIG